MSIQILGQGDTADVVRALRDAIRETIPDAEIEIEPGGSGHYTIRVTADVFAGRRPVQQQQLVYGAIAHLMSGPNPPVHAVDRMECHVRGGS